MTRVLLEIVDSPLNQKNNEKLNALELSKEWSRTTVIECPFSVLTQAYHSNHNIITSLQNSDSKW